MSGVYLSGPIAGLTYGDCTDWRQYAAAQLARVGICSHDPMRCKAYLNDGTKIAAAPNQYTHPLSTKEGITCRDRFDTMRADVVLVNLLGAERISIGTVMEIAWADAFRKPIVLALEPDNAHQHPILIQCCGFVVSTLDEAIEVVKSLLG